VCGGSRGSENGSRTAGATSVSEARGPIRRRSPCWHRQRRRETSPKTNDKLQDPDLDPAAAEAIGDALEALEGQNDGTANNGAVDHLESGNLNAAL
jgi:hypothetical protein